MRALRVQCSAEGCTNTILPATAQANGGLCAPCFRKRRAEEREIFVRANRRAIDPYSGLTDPVEILRAFHTAREFDPLIAYAEPPRPVVELYAELRHADAIRLMALASTAKRAGQDDFDEGIGRSLATLTTFALDSMLKAWISKNDFWPPIMFRNAGAEIRDAIVRALDAGIANANHGLSALGWIGDTVVEDRFLSWDRENRPWRGKLYIPPSEFAKVAGWELTERGRRNLFHKDCFAIKSGTSDRREAITVMEERDDSCPWCGRKLVNLIELKSNEARLSSLNLNTPKLPILTCDACTCFGVIYASVGHDGEARWLVRNQRPDYLPTDLTQWGGASPWRGVPIELHQRRGIETIDWHTPITVSQIGGLPSWVQDFEYPRCPDCQQVMPFLVQIDEGAFPGHEGVYYGFLCANCGITATTYQQT